MRKSIVLLALGLAALTVAGSAGASRHAGTFKYFCAIHNSMTGTIVVK